MLTSVINDLDNQKPAFTTRANWYLRLALFSLSPVANFCYNEVVVNGKPFNGWMLVGAFPAFVTAAIGFMSKSAPEPTLGQIQKKVEAAQLIAAAPVGVRGEIDEEAAERGNPRDGG